MKKSVLRPRRSTPVFMLSVFKYPFDVHLTVLSEVGADLKTRLCICLKRVDDILKVMEK